MERSVAEDSFAPRPKKTKRQKFLADIDSVVPSARLLAVVEQIQPTMITNGGRPAFPAAVILRIHFMQLWFTLSDSGMEEALHDIPAMRAFAGLDKGNDLIPNESSILRFRHRLVEHGIAEQLLAKVNAVLAKNRLFLRQGT